MPLIESTPEGAPVWTDIATSDFPRAQDFYASLFGWTFDEQAPEEYGGYTSARKKGRLVAGLSPHHPEYGSAPNVWGPYLKTIDVAATANAVSAAGGSVLVPPMHVSPFGHMAVFIDSAQAVIGGWQPETHQGFGLVAEPGAPCWHELHTRDFDRALAFYEQAFGWKISLMSDTDDFRYATLGEGDEARAGLMDSSRFLPEAIPAHWITYWGSANVDRDCEKIQKLGGLVLRPPEDSPYGRMASVADPMGARFNLVSA